MPDFDEPAEKYGETTADLKSADDTMSSESAVNLDQGDPLAEADHPITRRHRFNLTFRKAG